MEFVGYYEAMPYDDFIILMEDGMFVDFMNVYLSLPIFHHRLLYRKDTSIFQIDPELKNRDQHSVMSYIHIARLPYFIRSDLYLEYLMCLELIAVELYLVPFSHNLTKEEAMMLEDRQFLIRCIGNVVGMCNFRHYIKGTSGEKILEFWKDAERFNRTSEPTVRNTLSRELQLKYFYVDGITQLHDQSLWNALRDSATAAGYQLSNSYDIRNKPSSFYSLQRAILVVLRKYWLQKYLLHKMVLENRVTISRSSEIYINRYSDMHILKMDEEMKKTCEDQLRASCLPLSIGNEEEDYYDTLFEGEVEGPLERDEHAESLALSVAEADRNKSALLCLSPCPLFKHRPPSIMGRRSALGGHDEESIASRKSLMISPDFSLCRLRNTASHKKYGLGKFRDKLPSLCDTAKLELRRRTSPVDLTTATKELKAMPQKEKKAEAQRPPITGPKRKPQIQQLVFNATIPGKGTYRYDNKLMLTSLASDIMGGRPFLEFLQRHKYEKAARRLQLWYEIHRYLSLRILMKDVPTAIKLCEYRAHNIIVRFLIEEDKATLLPKTKTSPDFVELPTGVGAIVAKLMVPGKADDILIQVQDFLSQGIERFWTAFGNWNEEKFLEKATSTLYSHPTKVISAAGTVEIKADMKEKIKLLLPRKPASAASQETEDGEPEEEKLPSGVVVLVENKKTYLQRKMWRALQLMGYVNKIDVESLMVEPLDLSDVEFNGDGISGSLALKRRVLQKRPDIAEYEERQHVLMETAMLERMFLLKEISRSSSMKTFSRRLTPESVPSHSELPHWARSLVSRSAGKPTRPMSMIDILKNPTQFEYFRRYLRLMDESSLELLNFWQSVEALKTLPTTLRQARMSQIFNKYFHSAKGYASLGCDAGILKEIALAPKVTPAMLVTAQGFVTLLLEEKCLTDYQDSFPSIESELTAKNREPRDTSRFMGIYQEKGWHGFIRTIMRFRSALMSKKVVEMFKTYLRAEIIRDILAHKACGNSYSLGTYVERTFNNATVDVTKLITDIEFLAEAEQFRRLYDNTRKACKHSIYRAGEQQLLDYKAKIIIQGFIATDLSPKLQINITAVTADKILASYHSHMFDGSLFHEANMIIFPIMCYLWKRFQKKRFAEMMLKPKIVEPTKDEEEEKEKRNTNFVTMAAKDIRICLSTHDDDYSRIIFSLTHGVKILNPQPRGIAEERRANLHTVMSDNTSQIQSQIPSEIIPEKRKISFLQIAKRQSLRSTAMFLNQLLAPDKSGLKHLSSTHF